MDPIKKQTTPPAADEGSGAELPEQRKRFLLTFKPDGSIDRAPCDGTLTAEQLQSAVGGCLEAVYVRYGDHFHLAFVDKDGNAKGLPVNTAATKMAEELHGWPLRGNLVLSVVVGEPLTECATGGCTTAAAPGFTLCYLCLAAISIPPGVTRH